MALHLSFRAELANQVFLRLKRFDENAWRVAEQLANSRRDFFDLAYRLAHDAVTLLVEEYGPDLRVVLDARLGDVDALFSTLPSEESLEKPSTRWRVARGTVLAVYLHDSRGFNTGAFQELYAPVAALVDIGELERTALASLGEETGDFQVVTPRYEPPVITPSQQKRA
ncbi:MAG: hypothetical protein H7066_03325 [Cytophagaceae bacterium]|nr:hypothetical protein [Gemmatimonadaceae bacterium]